MDKAADARFANTKVKIENASKLFKIPKSDVQTFGSVYHDTNGISHCPVSKTHCSSRTEPLWSSFGKTVTGKEILENPIKVRLGESSKLGMLIPTP